MAKASSARMAVLRSGLLFTPFFALSLLALGYIVADVLSEGISVGRLVGSMIVGFMTLLLGYQVVQSLRDLVAKTVETVGQVERLWSRNEFMLFRNTYIFVKGNVFRVAPEDQPDIKLGDTVRVVHYPHTSTVQSVELLQRADGS